MNSTLKPWRELVEPHVDVLNGTFNQSEFAVDISLIHEGKGRPEYQDPSLFFQRTFITEGMSLLLHSVLKRLSSGDGDPVIQLQTAFGGGKTHTLLAVWHLATATCPLTEMPGVGKILDEVGLPELPKAKVAVIDGTKLSANQATVHPSLNINTLWGELAYQLGGIDAYSKIAASDQSGTAPGKSLIAEILAMASPCVVLMDEVVAYLRQFSDEKLSGGSFGSNMTFMQNLTEAMKMVPNAILLASLPESVREAGGSTGEKALEDLSHLFGRVQAIWKPVAKEESFNIVRRRLFSKIIDQTAAENVCRTFADFYLANPTQFPQETQNTHYVEELKNAYPIHPEVFARLYEDWSSLANFQRTRGVLKLMAKVIHKLWKDGNNDPLIMPGSLPLYDGDARNDIIYYLPVGWDPVLDKDIDGNSSQSTELDTQDTRFGSLQACRRISRTIFLGSAPSQSVGGSTINRGIEEADILLGSALPNAPVSTFHDALNRITEKLYYLNASNSKFWFDTRPNLRREMEERKKRYDLEACMPFVKASLNAQLQPADFDFKHIFSESVDIPDDENLRLVVLKPSQFTAFSRAIETKTKEIAKEYLEHKGAVPRTYQNRIIFITSDLDSTPRLIDHVKSYLSWNSIYEDYKNERITLDNVQARQAKESAERIGEMARRLVTEAFRWILVPSASAQNQQDIVWDIYPMQYSGSGKLGDTLNKILYDNEVIIKKWAPVHMKRMLDDYYWENNTEKNALIIWKDMCRYLYMARLNSQSTFSETLFEGAKNKENWGLAQGKDGDKYAGFVFGGTAMPVLDSSTLIIKRDFAETYEANVGKIDSTTIPGSTNGNGGTGPGPQPLPKLEPKRRYHAIAKIDPFNPKMQLDDIAKEIIEHLAKLDQTDIHIDIEINAESHLPDGFPQDIQRIIKENAIQLKFEKSDFE